jgi:hypothetical protein
MELITAFSITWAIGGVLAALAFWLTRRMSRVRRVLICSFIFAVAFTPSVVVQHTSAVLPAVLIFGFSPFEPMYGWSYGLMFGALPIGIVWALVSSIWWLTAKRGPAS